MFDENLDLVFEHSLNSVIKTEQSSDLNDIVLKDAEKGESQQKIASFEDDSVEQNGIKFKSNSSEPLPISQLSCNECKISFDSYMKLKLHRKQTKHSRVRCSKPVEEFYAITSYTVLYSCAYCEERFSSENKFNTHLLEVKHTRPHVYVCKYCYKSVRNYANMQEHLKIHKIATIESSHVIQNNNYIVYSINPLVHYTLLYSCKECSDSFNSKHKLREHAKLKHSQRATTAPSVCSICNKTFAFASRLRQHMRTHTKDKPYNCQICQKRFSVNCNLKRHILIHTGERPYVCEFCGISFNQSSVLAVHRQRHDGKNRFTCDDCGRCFKQKSTYIIHLRNHSSIHIK